MGNFSFTHKCEYGDDRLKKYFFSNSFNQNILKNETIDKDLVDLAEGSFSNVYSFKDIYAIKIMKNNYCNYLDNIPEIIILNELKSRYIIKCHCIFTIDNKLSLIMDKINYKLETYIFKNDNDRISVIEQLCEGLSFLHSKNILHLDFVPNNILINEEGDRPKIFISDFSHSCMTFNLSVSSKSHRISPFYRPYENLKGSYIYSDKSDIWSLGIIIYEILNSVKIENILIPITVELEYDPEMSILFFIERMIMWNKWPLKIKSGKFDIDTFLSLDKIKRTIFNFKKNESNIIIKEEFLEHSFNIYNIIDEDILPYYQRTEKLYRKIILYYDMEILENFFVNIVDVYKFCFCVIYSFYNFPDKITLHLNYRQSTFMLKMLSELNFQI